VHRIPTLSAAVLALLLLVPAAGLAQSGSSIAGVVKDATGGVMAGVTVEAASPSLIEKVRSAVTDTAGQYKIVNLVPGTYTVTFTLTGFNTIKREGIELTAAFTANVNADLKVGALEETITVSGTAPTVDVQNVTQQSVITRDILNAIPAGMKSTGQIGVLIPGVTSTSQDVGGTQFSAVGLAIHGSRLNEQAALYDGMPFNNGQGRGGQFVAITTNDATVQEMAIETAGLNAEAEASGVKINLVPRDGGNTFKGLFITSFTNHSLQSDNLSSGLKDRGLTSSATVHEAWDVDPAVGGPLMKDKLWFWASVRAQKTEQTLAGIYFNLTPFGHAYTPDLTRPALNSEKNQNASLRLTWQLTPKNKINIQQQNAAQQRPYYGYSLGQLTNAPEAVWASRSMPMYQSQITWNSPRTSKLLFDGGALFNNKDFPTFPQPDNAPGQIPYTDSGTGFTWGNYPNVWGHNASHNFNWRFAASYVTGSHAFKAGISFMHLWAWTSQDVVNNGMVLGLLNGAPRQVTIFATPFSFYELMNQDWGLFAQDQWTLKHVTINAGVRFDALNDMVPAQTLGPGPQVPTRNISFDEVTGVPAWRNTTPRLGVAWDVFGSGKTAVKVAIGKYLEAPNPPTFTRTANPAGGLVQSATRTWSDTNGDFIPQANELGPINPPNFGSTVVSTRYDPSALSNRIYNWELSAQVQQEVAPRVSVNLGYFRRWYGNLRVTDNLNIGPTDYSPYSVTAPADPRLPNGGGYVISGLYDPNFLAATNNIITLSNNYGSASEVYNGVDFTVNARLPGGVVLSGGPSVGRTESNYCFTIDSPQGSGLPPNGGTSAAGLLYCDVKPPFQPNVKVLGVYPLPWQGIQFAATFQSLPGPQITAARTFTNAEIRPTLGRNLATGAAGTATVQMIAPGTMYDERLYQLDLRASKIFRFGHHRLQANVDMYNAGNASSILGVNTTFGTNWLRPTSILQGRLVKLGGQWDF
jgi:Carboxypeptidase regulatory-like domain